MSGPRERSSPSGWSTACPRYTFARCGDIVVARFFGLADFEIDTATAVVVSHPRPEADPAIVPILLTGTIVAYLLSVGGNLVLHASAVEVDGGALAFIGYSGQGKTTLATFVLRRRVPAGHRRRPARGRGRRGAG